MGAPIKMKTLYDLKCAYKKAVRDNQDTFEIEGYPFVTGFTRYLIDYLDSLGIENSTALRTLLKKEDA